MRAVLSRALCALAVVVTGCGDDDATGGECPTAFEDGSEAGHAAPLGASATEARAGRLAAGDLPVVSSGLATWAAGDYVLANSKVALVIEAAGPSDLYDPWGGRPVGVARVDSGRLVEPTNFGEFFLLTGRSTVVTEQVSVINDGSDGQAAVIRARGKLHPLPFFEAVIAVAFADTLTDIEAAIDYVLEPGSDHVDVIYRYSSPREELTQVRSTLHAFMYTKRTPMFQPNRGFDDALDNAPYAVLVDDLATSWAYIPGEGALGSSLSQAGFVGAFGPGLEIPGCAQTERLHARIAIGKGLDGARVAVEGLLGRPQREITGTVTRMGVGISFAHVHAKTQDGTYVARATADDAGNFTLHVPADANITLDAYRRGSAVATNNLGTGTGPVTLTLPQNGSIQVTIDDGTNPSPGRIQVTPAAGTTSPDVPANWGEEPLPGGRLQVVYSVSGSATIPVPPGTWDVTVSRGYEYEIERTQVTVTPGAATNVDVTLDHVVDTTNTQCADFHIHTWRSNDSGDNATEKVRQAIADGVELPVRSEHEWVGDFAAEIADVGGNAFARGFGSLELTSFFVWGHMGVFPVTADPTRPNNGAPVWQTYPTAENLDTPFETIAPRTVFDAIRARPEAPVIIVNHPRGSGDYFNYVGFDPVTGIAANTADFDPQLALVEVFNESGWLANRDGTVADWFALLRAGRRVFAVGSSDSHGMASSPVGYPRTCLALGTDDPRALTANGVRDTLAAGHGFVSGGIYPRARIGTAGPGDTVMGAGAPLVVDVEIQAPSWIDVDAIDVVVDGVTVDTIAVVPADEDPTNPAVRWRGQIPVQTGATGGFVVIAAYAQRTLDPVHPGRVPFGVTNPIFVTP